MAHSPKLNAAAMGTYAVRPFRQIGGHPLSSSDEDLLRNWIELNRQALVDFRDGTIEYTEDVLKTLKRI